MQEEWKDIIIEKKGIIYDYTGMYQVSNKGNVRNYKTNRVFKPHTIKGGYLRVDFGRNGKHERFLVHRLVANAFVENNNPEEYNEVNHINEDKQDNRAENLEWCTRKYNVNYGNRNEKTSEKLKGRIFSEESKKKMRDNASNKRKVVCVNTHNVFECLIDAREWANLKNSSGITKCCKGERNFAGKHPETGEKLKWMYYEDYITIKAE